MINFKKLQNESDEEFIFRICSIKTSDDTWQYVADGLNKELSTEYTESKFRKQFQTFQRMFEAVKGQLIDNEHIEVLEKKQEELYKQQVRTRDKIREHRKIIRDESRIENILDIIYECANAMPVITIPEREIILDGSNTAILKISDWHIGKVVNNHFNKYNKYVAKERVDKLVKETIKYCSIMNIGKLYVANLGDMVEGVLRVTSRVESEEDIVQQIIFVSELLSGMMTDLGSYGLELFYISTLDNHSRANIDYKQHIEKESFVKLIDFYLKARLKDEVVFINNLIDDNIGHLNIDGKNHFFVHGHLKAHNPSVIVQNISIPLGIRADYIHIGHWHKSEVKEYHFAKVYTNGSMCGTDDFAFNNGWFSKASQKIFICDNQNEMDITINL